MLYWKALYTRWPMSGLFEHLWPQFLWCALHPWNKLVTCWQLFVQLAHWWEKSLWLAVQPCEALHEKSSSSSIHDLTHLVQFLLIFLNCLYARAICNFFPWLSVSVFKWGLQNTNPDWCPEANDIYIFLTDCRPFQCSEKSENKNECILQWKT